MSAGAADHDLSAAMPASTAAMEGNVLSCSFYGCKQTFTDMQRLSSHKESHQIPTESLPGKMFHCSSVGCHGIFPNMEQLMEHMRCHYKPNHYFLCESCRAKLRSYQALLKHLHTCAKVAKNKVAKAEEVAPPLSQPHAGDGAEMAPDSALLSAGLQEAPGVAQGSMEDMQVDPGPPAVDPGPGPGPLLPASGGGLPTDGSLVPAPGTFPLLEASPFSQQPLAFPAQPHPDAPLMPFPAYQTPMQSSPPPGYGQHQLQPRLLRAAAPAPPGTLGPPTSPGSNAVWRKNQGQSFSSRILWEHTRGRYRCLQCGHATPTRQEMTTHIEGHHRGPPVRLQGDVDFRVVPPLQPKSSPDGEPSVYTQL